MNKTLLVLWLFLAAAFAANAQPPEDKPLTPDQQKFQQQLDSLHQQLEIQRLQRQIESEQAQFEFENQMRQIELQKRKAELLSAEKNRERLHGHPHRRCSLFLLIIAVVHILCAVWVYRDIQSTGISGLWIVLALLAGLLAVLVYAVVRLKPITVQKK